MNPINHPLTEARAAEIWNKSSRRFFLWHSLTDCTKTEYLTIMRAAHDAGKSDVQTTDDGWEPLDWSKNPARIGDEVEQTYVIRRVTHVRSGVIDSFDSDGDPCANVLGFGLIGERNHGVWRVRRKTFDPLAENNGKVLRDVVMRYGKRADVAILAGPEELLADWGHCVTSMHPCGITEFTTDDRRTRYTRHGGTWTADNLKETQND